VAERRFSAHTLIRREVGDVFAWVADYRNAPAVLEGVTRWGPAGEQTAGAGARFDVEMQVLGFPLSTELVIDVWDEPREIEWSSRSGLVSQWGGWTFESRPEGTRVTLTIAYRPPGGAAGNLIAGQADGLVRARLQRALETMKDVLEART
jgi:ribosome-associated toxin RatA of RatAB toxin-antitoxin module